MNKRTPIRRREPQLRARAHWRVTGVRDSVAFFGALGSLTPEATTLVLEGQDIALDVRRALTTFLELEMTVVPPGVGWPSDWRYSLRYCFSDNLLDRLRGLASHHAEPELCMHLFVARYSDPLLEWWDAFDNELLIARDIPELRIRLFCAKTGGQFEAVTAAV